jgi:hypothetical protein
MTEETSPFAELLAKAGEGGFQRSVTEAIVQLQMETDVEGRISASWHEHSGERTTYRNGCRYRPRDTPLSAMQPHMHPCRHPQPVAPAVARILRRQSEWMSTFALGVSRLLLRRVRRALPAPFFLLNGWLLGGWGAVLPKNL